MPRKQKPKTQQQLDNATNQRLLKTYGRGLDWYNEQFELQFGGCAVCGDGPKTRRLHVDHDHSWVKVKIVSEKINSVWWSKAEYNKQFYVESGIRKSESISYVKQLLKVASVRALLCHRCNRGAILFRDKPRVLRLMAEYIEKHQNGDK